MAEETNEVVVEEEIEEETPDDELESETTDWKAEAIKARAIAKRRQTQIEKLKTPKEPELKPKAPEQKNELESSELGYGEKAFLRSYEIKGADELELVKNWVKRTGDSIDAVVEDEIFLAKLKGLRDAREAKQAMPSGSKRTSVAPHDTVEYHISKGTDLMDISDMKLRREVLAARVTREKNGGRFSDHPVVT